MNPPLLPAKPEHVEILKKIGRYPSLLSRDRQEVLDAGARPEKIARDEPAVLSMLIDMGTRGLLDVAHFRWLDGTNDTAYCITEAGRKARREAGYVETWEEALDKLDEFDTVSEQVRDMARSLLRILQVVLPTPIKVYAAESLVFVLPTNEGTICLTFEQRDGEGVSVLFARMIGETVHDATEVTMMRTDSVEEDSKVLQ